MTDIQFNEIKRRRLGDSHHQAWYRVFDILFPGARRPLSPYVSTCDPIAVEHFVNFFRAIGPEEMFNVLRDRRERGESAIRFTAPTHEIVSEAFEIALPSYLAELHNYIQPLDDPPEAAGPVVGDRDVGRRGSEARTYASGQNPSNQLANAPDWRGPSGMANVTHLLAAPFDLDIDTISEDPDWQFEPSEVYQAFDDFNVGDGGDADESQGAPPWACLGRSLHSDSPSRR